MKSLRRAAKLAEDATAAGDDSFIQPPFTRTVTGYSRWDVTLVEGSPEPQANGDGFVFAYTLTPSTRHGPVADGALLLSTSRRVIDDAAADDGTTLTTDG